MVHVELLNGGLVTSRDPAFLGPGELTQAIGVYKPFSPDLHATPGNATFSSDTDVTGLAYCAFDYINIPVTMTQNAVTVNAAGTATFAGVSVGARVLGDGVPEGATVATKPSSTQITLSSAATATQPTSIQIAADNLLVAQAGGNLKTAIAGTSGTFTTVESYTAGDYLDSVHYGNKHVLFNGKNANRVLRADGTLRAHGLKPITTSPSLNVTTTAGAWALETGTGYYGYWTTEYDKTNDIESDFQGKIAVANVDATTKKVVITRPSQINASATHWRAYRSTKLDATTQEEAENIATLIGEFIGEAELKDDGTQNTIDDGGGTTAVSSAAGATGVGTVGVQQKRTDPTKTITWTNTANATGTTNSAYSTVVYNTTDSLGATDLLLELGNFGLTTGSITPPITGVQVTVWGKKVGNGKLSVGVYSTEFTNNPIIYSYSIGGNLPKKTVPLTTTNASYVLGSANDKWLPPGQNWSPSWFANGKFVVRLYATVRGGTDQVDVDAVQVSVSYGKAQQLGTLEVFPTITVAPFGQEVVVGRNGEPPKCTTGDVFQDSLVTNDITDESLVRYSFPANIDAFPTVYFLNFDTKDQDRVTCIKTLNNVLIVGLSSKLYRVAYLPRETDAEYDRGRAIELIDENNGIVGPGAACVFSHANGQQLLAFISRTGGWFATDGYRTWPIVPDSKWEGLVNSTELPKTLLVNNPTFQELLTVFNSQNNATTGQRDGILRANYHASHVKEGGGLKCSEGPLGTYVRTLVPAVLRDGSLYLYVSTTTGVYYHNQTPTGPHNLTATTRHMLLGGAAAEYKIEDVYLRYSLFGNAPTSIGSFNLTTKLNKHDAAAAAGDVDYSRTTTAKFGTVLGFTATTSNKRDARTLKYSINESGEGIHFTASANTTSGTNDLSLGALFIRVEGIGDENSK